MLLAGEAKFLVLINGKKLLLDKGCEVKKGKVLFKSKTGRLLQVPVDLVDLEASERETDAYYRNHEKKDVAKPLVRNAHEYPDELFNSESRIRKNMVESERKAHRALSPKKFAAWGLVSLKDCREDKRRKMVVTGERLSLPF